MPHRTTTVTLHEFVYEVVLKPRPLRVMTNAALRAACPSRKRLGSAWWTPNPNDPVVSGGAALGLYDRSGTAFFKKYCKPGMTFLDIGANTGYFSAWAIGLMRGNGRIIAFEPDPEARRYLESTRDANGCSFMSVISLAASDTEGIAQLYKNEENRGDNRLWKSDDHSSPVNVQCASVDSVLRSLGIGSVDLIKMDVQGFEGHALRGMKETLKCSPNLILLTEFWPWGLAKAGSDPNELIEVLETLGFSLFTLGKGGLLKPMNDDHSAFIESLDQRECNIVGLRNPDLIQSAMVAT